ncbi:MAG: radical SAM protein [Methanothermobacter sp.]|nr:radical SAM protein [Methanothermobacter sp.]
MLTKGSEDETNMGDMINAFKRIAENPLSRLLINFMLHKCEKDDKTRLEAALDNYINDRNCCMECKILSYFLSHIIKSGAKAFGVTEEELKKQMSDQYWLQGLINVLKGIGIFGVRRPFVPGAPFQVVWNITHRCNMNCKHCYETAGTPQKNELDKNEVIEAIDILADNGVTSLAFSGGEPSIHPNILDYISHARERGLYVAMATNGYILADEGRCQKFVDAGLQFVQVSIDSLNPNVHDTFRGVKGSWKRACKAVKNFSAHDVFVEVAMTVTAENYHQIQGMIELASQLGADWLMLFNFIPTGRGIENINLDISPSRRYRILRDAYYGNFNNGIQVLSTAPQFARVAEELNTCDNQIIPTHFYNPEYTNPDLRQLADFIGGCGAGRFYLSMEPNGDIYPCVFFPHQDELKIGNILEDDFEKLWKNNSILEVLRDREQLHGTCHTCKSKNICGGCRARAYGYFKDICAPDPGCIKNQNLWDKIKESALAK